MSVSLVLLKQSVSKFQELLRDGFEYFETLDSFEKAYLVLDSELWDDDFIVLCLILDYIVNVWGLG